MPVEVTLQGAAQTTCVEACWNALGETTRNYERSCAGRYHGAGAGPRLRARDGLAVENDYTTHTFTAYPRP